MSSPHKLPDLRWGYKFYSAVLRNLCCHHHAVLCCHQLVAKPKPAAFGFFRRCGDSTRKGFPDSFTHPLAREWDTKPELQK